MPVPRFLFHLLMLLLCPFLVKAQPGFIVQQYSNENGLPSNGVKGLQWDDASGFLWIGTEGGVVRFNGVDFLSFNRQNNNGIKSERVLFLARNHRGVIHAAGEQKDIATVYENRLRPMTESVYDGNEFRLWLLSVSARFRARKLPISGVFSSYDMVEANVAPLSDTSCIFLLRGQLYRFSISMPEPEKIQLSVGRVKELFSTADRFFITGGNNQVYQLDAVAGGTNPVALRTDKGAALATNEQTQTIWVNGMEQPVFISNTTAWLLEWNGSMLIARQVADNLPEDVLIRSAQYSEKNKVLFLGTDSKGLITVTPARVQPQKRTIPNKKGRNAYYGQIELPDGNILTNEGDIIGEHPMNPALAPSRERLGFSIARTSDTVYWYTVYEPSLSYHCLHRYNSRTQKITLFPKIKMSAYFAGAEVNGRTYISTAKGVSYIDGDSLRYVYLHKDSAAMGIPFDLVEITPGKLALATCYGLLRLDLSNARLDTLFKTNGACIRTIKNINGYTFLGTYGSGIYIYKNGRVKPIPLDKNKYLSYTHCFVPDEQGFCWMSTNRGLFKASLTDMIYAFDHDVPQLYYEYYGRNDGMDITEMNGGCLPCALVLRNKNISFPTMDGLLWVNPKTEKPLPEGNIFIDRITVDDTAVDPEQQDHIYLPSKTKEILMRLGFSAWCNRENILLEYRLNNEKWMPVDIRGGGATIRFSNLLPGQYTLEIRKQNGFGIENYSYKTIEFTIIVPWYKKWWFYGLVALLLIMLGGLITRLRTRQYKINQARLQKQVQEKTSELQQQNEQLEKNNNIKTRLISIISHDLVTPLKFVTVGGKNLIDNKQVMPEELQDETLLEIVHTAQELQQLCTNILNWIKYQNENRQMLKEIVNLHQVVNQVISILQSLAREKGIKLVNNIPEELTIYQYLEPLKILVYNLVTNALNFSTEGDIYINAAGSREHIAVSVKDSGVGMTPEQVRNIMSEQIIVSSAKMDSNRRGNGLGYLIIKDLVKMTGASLRIQSEKGKGTEVFIDFPLITNP